MSEQPKLGQLADNTAARDAIHIAITPVTSALPLAPGQHVGLIPGTSDRVTTAAPHVGIVDPYLTQPVQPGQRFYLCLYPQTVTSLRHEWTHPAFGAEKARDAVSQSLADVSRSIKWIEDFAAKMDYEYDYLMDAAKSWVESGCWTKDNNRGYDEAESHEWPLFWMHFERVTGMSVSSHDDKFFTCSC